MDVKRLVCLVFLMCFGLTACVGLKDEEQRLLVKSRDLSEQVRVGNGEGLAKPIKNQPVLVNNQLIFAAMGDAVLGIAMTIGTNNKTVGLFSSMAALNAEQSVQQLIEQHRQELEWQALVSKLRSQSQVLEIEPYGYLNGHPSARLQVRVRLSLKHEEGEPSLVELYEESESFSLSGDKSWSADNGQLLAEQFQMLLAKVFARIPESL